MLSVWIRITLCHLIKSSSWYRCNTKYQPCSEKQKLTETFITTSVMSSLSWSDKSGANLISKGGFGSTFNWFLCCETWNDILIHWGGLFIRVLKLIEQDVFVKYECPRNGHLFENCDLDIWHWQMTLNLLQGIIMSNMKALTITNQRYGKCTSFCWQTNAQKTNEKKDWPKTICPRSIDAGA